MDDLGWLALTLTITTAYVLVLVAYRTPRPGRWSNCYLVSVALWWRHGGYVLVTRSRYGWWPHMLWSRELRTVVEWEPDARKRVRWLPPVLYRGRLRTRRLCRPERGHDPVGARPAQEWEDHPGA